MQHCRQPRRKVPFTSKPPTASRSARQARHTKCRSHRLHVVATSEFWWEDEQEFDALTEVLLPKQVVVCTPTSCQQQLQQLSGIKFVGAFTSQELQQAAEQLWEELGRFGPPLFLKVRVREALQAVGQGDQAAAAAAADQFWQELTGQTWKTELDYGLKKDQTAALQPAAEQLLVLVGSQQAVQNLAAAAVADSHHSSSSGGSSSSNGLPDDTGICVVQFSGWNQGEAQQQLTSWKQLAPQIGQLPVADSALVQQL